MSDQVTGSGLKEKKESLNGNAAETSTGSQANEKSVGGDKIEEQLGNLPDLPSDDDKDEKEQKPVVKHEPGECLTQSDLEALIEVISKDTYSHCDIHKEDRMERVIVCIPCKQLICPLCLMHSHQSHDIRSISSMREYFKVKDTVENNVFELQLEHQKLKELFKERKDLTREVQKSTERLIEDINKKFKAIMTILQTKQDQLVNYVKQFESQNIEVLNKDMDVIRDMLYAATNMITRAITFFSKIDLKEADTLPTQVSEVVKKCKCSNIKSLPNKDIYRPDRKFSKLLPSLDAIANICDTIHAEATKVVWTKTTKNSEHEDKKGTKSKPEKRKHHSNSSEKSFKKPKTSAHSTSSSSTTESVSSHKVAAEDAKKNGDKNESESKKEPGGRIVQHRKSVDSTASGTTTDPYDSESDKSECSTGMSIPPKLKLVELKATSIDTGKCLLAKVSEESESDEKVLLGKVVDSFKMKDTTQYTVNWLKGHLGKDSTFEIRKKQEPVHSSAVICNFEFDCSKPMSPELKNELLLAKEFYNTKKTRKRKQSQTSKEKPVSPKKSSK